MMWDAPTHIFGQIGKKAAYSRAATSFRCLAVALAVGTLSSCALVGSSEAPRETFDITAPQQFSGVRGGSRAQILVKVPTALSSIDSNRIILKPNPSVVTYLAGAQWTDTVPKLVQAKLVESFENAGATRATAKPGDGLIIDYQLVSDIRSFEVYDGAARISISIKLLSDRSGLVRETRIFNASSRAEGENPADFVAAFDESFDKIARDIVAWVVRRT